MVCVLVMGIMAPPRKIQSAMFLVGAAVVRVQCYVAIATVVIDGKAFIGTAIIYTIGGGCLLAAAHAIISVAFHGGRHIRSKLKKNSDKEKNE